MSSAYGRLGKATLVPEGRSFAVYVNVALTPPAAARADWVRPPPSVKRALAIPCVLVATVPGLTCPPPLTTVHVILVLATGFPYKSASITPSESTGSFTKPWPSGERRVIVAGGPATGMALNVAGDSGPFVAALNAVATTGCCPVTCLRSVQHVWASPD